MLDQNFSPENLSKFIYSKQDLIKLKLGRSKIERLHALAKKSYAIEGEFSFNSIITRKINGKSAHTIKDGTDKLLLRKLNDNIVRIFGIRQSDRNETTKQIFTLLQEANPFCVVRLDVKGFYESISLSEAIEPILNSTVLSPLSKKLLTTLNTTASFNDRLPRGINVSAAISELKMRSFDRQVTQLEHVYFYARYVDDIFIFSHNTNITIEEITSLLPANLYINKDKSYLKKVQCRNLETEKHKNPCSPACKCKADSKLNHEIEYLGYNFSIPDVPNAPKKDHPRKVSITLSQRKISKIKTRTVKALLDHIKRPNFPLLKSRMFFLTGNCEFTVKGGTVVRSGLHYNFPLISSDDESLVELTTFLRKMVHCKKGSLGGKISATLSSSERQILGRLSFSAGHRNKMTYRFSEDQMKKIRECWQQ